MKKLTLILMILLAGMSISQAQPPKKVNHPPAAIPDMSVDDLLKAVKNQANDIAKMDVIKRVMGNMTDGIMVAQELRLLNQFSTDDAKLDCAKFLYAWCVDYKNYDKVMYNMASPAAQASLKKFIAAKGGK